MFEQRRFASALLAAVLACGAVLSSGCGDSPSGSSDAAGTPKNRSDEPQDLAQGTRSDTPPHPAVSAKIGPNDGSLPPDAPANPSSARPTVAPPPGALPDVALTAAHRSACKLFVGDTLPPLTLADLDGNATPLDKLLGQRLTLVMFWQAGDADAVEALTDVAPLVLAPYGGRGVRTVAIHVGEATDEIKSLAEQNQLAYPLLIDADGAGFARIADDALGLMPRIFLVDAAGRILWFDIEYSRTTRRDLDRALRYLTRE